ncbi:SURF1 family cytochrome oxidase biogenesis protein [Austwickia chelonae]|uniref:SURF1 family cytochrome oxidase biogenesis protein n=1 Tax=Austwickia chelonae TaxID=100225 RepID=UPI001F086D7D|nr:SURF1 family protein [Austwickia chelonae]
MRTVLTRRWLTAIAVATAFFVLCLFLGRWQWGRHVQRSSIADAVERNYATTAVPLDEVLPQGAELPDERLWTKVQMRGTYDHNGQLFVRNRPQKVTYGYEILVPLSLPDGTALIVDRGWVKNAERADVLPQVPPPPAGEVTVTGWLRHGEESLGRDLPAGQLASVNLQEAAERTRHPIRKAAYLVLDSEDDGSGHQPARPSPLLPPDTGIGPHFAYSLQWWGGSIVGFVIVGVYIRREHLDRLVAEGKYTRPVPVPRKKRIWDEEDE